MFTKVNYLYNIIEVIKTHSYNRWQPRDIRDNYLTFDKHKENRPAVMLLLKRRFPQFLKSFYLFSFAFVNFYSFHN